MKSKRYNLLNKIITQLGHKNFVYQLGECVYGSISNKYFNKQYDVIHNCDLLGVGVINYIKYCCESDKNESNNELSNNEVFKYIKSVGYNEFAKQLIEYEWGNSTIPLNEDVIELIYRFWLDKIKNARYFHNYNYEVMTYLGESINDCDKFLVNLKYYINHFIYSLNVTEKIEGHEQNNNFGHKLSDVIYNDILKKMNNSEELRGIINSTSSLPYEGFYIPYNTGIKDIIRPYVQKIIQRNYGYNR